MIYLVGFVICLFYYSDLNTMMQVLYGIFKIYYGQIILYRIILSIIHFSGRQGWLTGSHRKQCVFGCCLPLVIGKLSFLLVALWCCTIWIVCLGLTFITDSSFGRNHHQKSYERRLNLQLGRHQLLELSFCGEA